MYNVPYFITETHKESEKFAITIRMWTISIDVFANYLNICFDVIVSFNRHALSLICDSKRKINNFAYTNFTTQLFLTMNSGVWPNFATDYTSYFYFELSALLLKCSSVMCTNWVKLEVMWKCRISAEKSFEKLLIFLASHFMRSCHVVFSSQFEKISRLGLDSIHSNILCWLKHFQMHFSEYFYRVRSHFISINSKKEKKIIQSITHQVAH